MAASVLWHPSIAPISPPPRRRDAVCPPRRLEPVVKRPSSDSSSEQRGRIPVAAQRLFGLANWSDPDKVLLVSGLMLPFALAWIIRSHRVMADPSLSTYVSQSFLPTLLVFLWVQFGGHLLLVLGALGLRRRRRHTPWLVHLEVQFWNLCAAFTLYAVGMFTSPHIVLALMLPVIGYFLFDARAMHYGVLTLTVGGTIGWLLPVLKVVPYAPFLSRAPFENGRIEPGWISFTGLPALVTVAVGVVIHYQLVGQLKDRQEELERISSTDSLTGLATRGVLFRRLADELGRAVRRTLPVSVIMLDVDHFKTINDTEGHLAGDEVLRRLGSRLKDALRAEDLGARYGGEEFAIVLPDTGLDAAIGTGERLRQVLSEPCAEGKRVTVSLGIAQWTASETVDELLARADAALYKAKRNGRNQVVAAEAGESSEPASPHRHTRAAS